MSLNFVDNELLREADNYLREHRIIELFEDLATYLSYKQPEEVESSLADFLTVKKEQGARSGIFTESEVQNVFNLFDLKKEGIISKDRCIKAIQTMANSSYQVNQTEAESIPDKVDANQFCKLCERILGFSNKEI